jgi:thiol-disulfide isomerase/thioredoxin
MINNFFSFLTVITIGAVTVLAQTTMQPATMEPAGTPSPAVTTQKNDFPLATRANFKTRLPKDKHSKNKKAQEKYLEGEIAKENENFKEARDAFRQAVELDPDFYAAHELFITMSGFVKLQEQDPKTLLPGQRNPLGLKTRATPYGAGPAADELIPLYQSWTAKYPKKAAVHWGLGQCTLKYNDAQALAAAEASFRQALAIDSKFAPAYKGLAMIGLLSRNETKNRENLALAYKFDNSVERGYEYAQSLGQSDPQLKKEIVDDILKRFPTSKQAFFALNDLAYSSTNDGDRAKYFEKMWRMFPEERAISVLLNMEQLFGLWLNTKPEMALELAQDMVKRFPKDKYPNFNNWENLEKYQKAFVAAKKAVAEKKYDEAVAILKSNPAPRASLDQTSYFMLKATAESKGDEQAAYDLLLKNAVGKYNVNFNKALYAFGAKVGKTQPQMDDEMWNLRVASAKVFKDFQLIRHDNDQPVKLSDFRGKVVFVSFWFPGCGPCIAEFPYLRAAKEKFGPQGYEMLFINIVQKDDPQALPVLGQHKMNVISLKIPEDKWAVKEYGVSGAPTNFLIDGEGRILFMPKVNNQAEVRDFEAQIEMLLNRAKMSSAATTNK